MTLKTYAAIVTGALAMVLTTLLLWAGTKLPLQDVIAVSMIAYYAGLAGTYAGIEWMEKRRRKILKATIITLCREEWEAGRNADVHTDREGAAGAQ